MNDGEKLSVGDRAPDFCLPNQNDQEVCLSDLSGKWVVLYFYPKDNTSGCTREAVDFTSHIENFEEMGAVVIGISPDSTKSHRSFIEKKELKLQLLSDGKHEVLEKYGVWQLKKMYGKEYMGVVRSTFLLNPNGEVAHVWRKVRVKGHVDEVLETLKKLKS